MRIICMPRLVFPRPCPMEINRYCRQGGKQKAEEVTVDDGSVDKLYLNGLLQTFEWKFLKLASIQFE